MQNKAAVQEEMKCAQSFETKSLPRGSNHTSTEQTFSGGREALLLAEGRGP